MSNFFGLKHLEIQSFLGGILTALIVFAISVPIVASLILNQSIRITSSIGRMTPLKIWFELDRAIGKNRIF